MSLELIIISIIAVIFLAGMVALWLMLGVANRQLASQSTKPKVPTVTGPTAEELEQKLKTAYELEISKSTTIFAGDLQVTSARLSEQVSRLTTQVIEEELGAYQSTLEELRKVAAGTMDQIRANVEAQRLELRASMEAEVAAEKVRHIEKFQAKMGDIISGYIAESIGGGIDLSTQMNYILGSLETHKDDIKKDLTSGV